MALGRLVPSARGLLVFEAAARTGSCSAAAREFNLTQPSVSRNIAQLEAHLGIPLFIRSPAGMELTAEGSILHTALSEGFQRVAAAIQEIVAQRTRLQVVELSLSTAFVTHWFIPRLGAFHAAFPGIDLRFQLISGTLRGPPGNVDLAMRMSGDADHEFHSWPFAPELIIPVGSPRYLAQHGTLEAPAPGSRHTLLHLSDTPLHREALWGGVVGTLSPQPVWIEFSDYGVVLQAAMNGEGVALGWITVVARALGLGTLVPVSRRHLRTGKSYHLLASRARPVREVVAAIRDWMVAQMRQDMEQAAPLLGELAAF
ncbi:MAG: LysR family transcriptional regulator [Rhodospirillales bacterium]|nr:LysR family transcriptional regulator [Rhodospirillales bacterium]